MGDAKVLIVGAGPTGLVLAVWLRRYGVPVRIIDRNAGPGTQSRAMAVQARTLEYYRQLGYEEELIPRGTKMKTAHLMENNDHLVDLPFEDLGAGISPFPYAFCLAQDDHERYLTEKLAALGVAVEWDTELKDFSQDASAVKAVAQKGDHEETVSVEYLCGCDGARSQVRERAGLKFPGGTYDHVFFVADVRNSQPWKTDLYANLADEGLALMFPVRSSGMQRLIGTLPQAVEKQDDITFEDIRPHVESVLPVKVAEVNWFSTYHVHHRVAEHFQVGRVFIAGDAGHIHSPAGGQGMNTGIGDAVNLAWKLAAVVQGRAATSLLDTYEPERIAFARKLINSTDTAFKAMVGRTWRDQFFRKRIVPLALPRLVRLAAVRKMIFRTVSQTRIHYRHSELSTGKAGQVHGGDRLPWVSYGQADNFKPLQSLKWQVHVYGGLREEFGEAVRELGLEAHELPWSPEAEKAGLLRDAAYLVRPDGHVALAMERQDMGQIHDYRGRFSLIF